MFLENLDFDEITVETKAALSQLCMYVHRSVEKECVNFFRKFRRRVYTTPKSYIDLIESYK